MEFPEWSDLGGKTSTATQGDWAAELQRVQRYDHYYSGRVFEEYLEKERPQDPDIPLFPAGINLVKIIVMALTDAMFGDWSDLPIQFSSTGTEQSDSSDAAAIDLATEILRASGGQVLWEAELDRNRYGGCAMRATATNTYPFVRWSRVYRDAFFPVWDPEDPDNLLEVWAITRMTADQARAKFPRAEFASTGDNAIYAEHITPLKHETFLNGTVLQRSVNRFGVVPFAYIPRMRTSLWWGDAVTEDLIAPQDEINMRVADVGDISADSAHPIIWGVNLPRGFDRDNYPRGSNKLWDLGRTVGEFEPKVGTVEVGGNVLPAVLQHIEFLERMAYAISQTPAIAFGSDNGGGQRSGDTLEIRLRPLVAGVSRSRLYMNSGIRRLLRVTAALYKSREMPGIPRRAVEHLAKLQPAYADILPRRRPEIVDEIVKLLSTDPPAISLETAIKWLGLNVREVALIKEMLADQDMWKQPVGQAAIELEEKKAAAEAERQMAMLKTKQVSNAENSVSDGRARPVSGRPGQGSSAKADQ